MSEWHRRFFGRLYGQVLSAQFTQEQTQKQVEDIVTLLGLRPGMRVLDVACGFGRIALPLARRGIVVTGVDLAGAYLRRARREARRADLSVRFAQVDMRRVAFREEFDAALSWFTSFGYFSDEENLLCLRRLRAALRPGGRLLIETMNRSLYLAHFRPRTEQTIGGVRIVRHHRYDPCALQVRDTWVFSRGRRRERCANRIRIYNGAEMRRILKQAGFVDVRLFSRVANRAVRIQRFTRHSPRLLAVAERRA